MINEHMEEQAALHVLGALTESEAREFKEKIQADPELQRFVSRLSVATVAMAGAAPLAEPPPQLRAKILAQVALRQKTVSLPERKFGPLSWLPWAFATCLAILCVVLWMQNGQLHKIVRNQANQIGELDQLAQSLQLATNNLQQAMIAFQETNRLTNLRIAVLNSLLPNAPKATATTVWDNKKQDGVFMAENLKPLPANRDYQLWVIDPQYKTPVDAGVFQVDAQGIVRKTFKTKFPIHAAEKFAVTEEPKGGVAVPTLKNMVLLGG